MKFKIITLGCKVNTYESEYIREQLLKNNYILSEEHPDIIIINTCSVTNEADNKSLKLIRRTKRENPNCILVVCGCSAQNNPAKYQAYDIDILIGNKDKSKIVDLLNDYLKSHTKYSYFTDNRNLDFEDMHITNFATHTRAFIKIQDGCDNFCSYCIIPYVRGSIRSKDFSKVINEAQELVRNGHKEIVLTGIHTGSYNSENHDLSDLIKELSSIKDLERIRISSIEITELNSKFMEVLKTCPKVCNHLHIPLQSGSEKILKRMNRKYDKAYFEEKIKEIRAIRPDIAITTDIIVGHPYETDSDFEECLKFAESLNFAKIHVFPYSMRNGTAAATMPQVDNSLKKERAKQLIALSNKLEAQYYEKFLNQEVLVLTEEYENNYLTGHTSNYLKVYLPGDYHLNTLYNVKITSYKDGLLYGEVLTCSNSKISL